MSKSKSLFNIILILAITSITSCEKKTIPEVDAFPVSDITTTSAILNGAIIDDGGEAITSRGFRFSTSSPFPETATIIPIPGSVGSFESTISDLSPGTIYYAHVFGTNLVGEGRSAIVSFSTLGNTPLITNQTATSIKTTSATLSVDINPSLLATNVTFEWGTSTLYGNTVTPPINPINGGSFVNITTDLINLAAGTEYHFRIKAENSLGTTNSVDMTFITFGQIPDVITGCASDTLLSSATFNGLVNPNYLETTVSFEWGTTRNYGNAITISEGTITGISWSDVSVNLSVLEPGTTYHYRVCATNELGTACGNDTTLRTFAVADIDGNLYQSVIIGDQEWFVENLRVTKYNDGTQIDNVTGNDDWVSLQTPAYCWYDNDETANKSKYGALYNWMVVDETLNNQKNVCPDGWHAPLHMEWFELWDYLRSNGYGFGGSGDDIAKSMAAKNDWSIDPVEGNVGNNPETNNSSGFAALPAGIRTNDDSYYGIGLQGAWWVIPDAYEVDNNDYNYSIFSSKDILEGSNSYSINTGLSVRCIKNPSWYGK